MTATQATFLFCTLFQAILTEVQRRAIRLIGDLDLTFHLQPLSHRRAVGDFSLFYRYSSGFCSSELTSIIPKCGEAVETAKHVIFDCPALCRRRSSYLEVVQEEGRQCTDHPCELQGPLPLTSSLYHIFVFYLLDQSLTLKTMCQYVQNSSELCIRIT
nr:unnamed protein product [Callosobruchus chinensis]